MDSWASLEHEIKYKQEVKHVPLIGKGLEHCADELASCDISHSTTIKGYGTVFPLSLKSPARWANPYPFMPAGRTALAHSL